MNRLWNRTDRTSGCWEWIGGKTSEGYGSIRINGKMIRTHRLAWELTYGTIPDGLFVCHHCDNRLCINPEHLFLGTHKDNMQDMVRKDRGNGGLLYGERNGNAKLTKAQVDEIRSLKGKATQTEIAKKYSICQAQVHNILFNQNWKA